MAIRSAVDELTFFFYSDAADSTRDGNMESSRTYKYCSILWPSALWGDPYAHFIMVREWRFMVVCTEKPTVGAQRETEAGESSFYY